MAHPQTTYGAFRILTDLTAEKQVQGSSSINFNVIKETDDGSKSYAIERKEDMQELSQDSRKMIEKVHMRLPKTFLTLSEPIIKKRYTMDPNHLNITQSINLHGLDA